MGRLAELLHCLVEHSNDTALNLTEAVDIIHEFESNLYTLDQFSTIVLLSLYVPIFLLGLVGNVLIILSVSGDKAATSNLYFLVNLALADLAVTILCIPTSVGTIIYKLWVYGRFLCKFTAFIQGVAVAVSIFSMTAMSVERYISLQYPSTSCRTPTAAQFVLFVIGMWLVAAMFMTPQIFIRDVDVLVDVPFIKPLPFCIETWNHGRDRMTYGVFLLFVIFIVPGFTIVICYGNVGKALFITQKHQRVNSDGTTKRLNAIKKTARMVIILIVVFMICWLPYNTISAVADLSEDALVTPMLPYVLWLGHAHSAINPLLYWSLNKRFRNNVHNLLRGVHIISCTSSRPVYI